MANTEDNYQSIPLDQERRYSIHGVNHMETGAYDNDPVPSYDDLYRRYCETVHGLDENLRRVLRNIWRNRRRFTPVICMSDNGRAGRTWIL